MKQQGQFVIIEGGDGAGKSTLVKSLAHALDTQGVSTIVTREPGGSPKAEEIRRLLLEREVGDNFASDAELLLFYASRLQHLHDTILPALKAGKIVLCDRFEATTYSYQVFTRGGNESLFQDLHRQVVDLLKPLSMPCYYVHLQVSVDVAKRRLATSGKTLPDVFDGREAAFHEQAKRGYEAVKHAIDPLFRHFDLDANQGPEAMVRDALAIVEAQS